jgi:hypothetical protein
VNDSDDLLLARLGDMFREVDPPPTDAVELARQSFALRNLDAELAELAEDSDESHAAMAVRASGPSAEPRELTFEGGDLTIAIEVTVVGPRRRLVGQLDPAGPTDVRVRQFALPEDRAVEVDQFGRFLVDGLLPGPTSLVCHRRDAAPVATQWTIL